MTSRQSLRFVVTAVAPVDFLGSGRCSDLFDPFPKGRELGCHRFFLVVVAS